MAIRFESTISKFFLFHKTWNVATKYSDHFAGSRRILFVTERHTFYGNDELQY